MRSPHFSPPLPLQDLSGLCSPGPARLLEFSTSVSATLPHPHSSCQWCHSLPRPPLAASCAPSRPLGPTMSPSRPPPGPPARSLLPCSSPGTGGRQCRRVVSAGLVQAGLGHFLPLPSLLTRHPADSTHGISASLSAPLMTLAVPLEPQSPICKPGPPCPHSGCTG